jgi:TDG/mug DNA glycosylase family protein
MDLKFSFPPVVDASTGLLVLGSLPGEVSLARAQYYAHPRNQFWTLMETVIDAELLALPYEARLARVLEAGVGLWDVVGQARRAGSLDGAIRDVRPNALGELIADLPALRAVAFNGAKAADIGRAQLPADFAGAVFELPSSSPAHTLNIARKAQAWAVLRGFSNRRSSG